MAQWLRTLVMLTGLGAWLAVVIVTLLRGQLPDAVLLGVPAGPGARARPARVRPRPRRRAQRGRARTAPGRPERGPVTGYWVEAAVSIVVWVAAGLAARRMLNRGERR